MSPEQARGHNIDHRADVYALGVLCHELLTGGPPITGNSPMVVLLAQLTQAPPRVSEVNTKLPSELDAPILRMLEKEADARPASASQALQELRKAAERAGFRVASVMPRLPRPHSIASTLDARPLSHDALADLEQALVTNDLARVTMVRTTAGHGHRKGRGWLLLGAAVLVAAGLTGVWSRFFRQTGRGYGDIRASGATTLGSVIDTLHPGVAPSVSVAAPPEPAPSSSASGSATPVNPSASAPQKQHPQRAQPGTARQVIPNDLESPF
jgi:serine/threonine protein kinase